MRFVITARPDDQNPRPPGDLSEELFADYMRFNEEMQEAGVLVAAEGLNPGAPGAQVKVTGGKRRVVDGPFTESKELVGGFYVIDVPSLAVATEWALRCPTGLGSDDILEIRQLTGAEDIPPELLALTRKVAPTWTATFERES